MQKRTIIGIIIAVVLLGVIAIIGRIAIIALIAVPNMTGIQERSLVNADIRTAEQIGKAIAVWRMDGRDRKVPTSPIEYDELEGLEGYISVVCKPTSLEDAKYYVMSEDGKIKVAIANEASEVEQLGPNDNYDGTVAGWAYIEGQY
jgi:hypothetical protein